MNYLSKMTPAAEEGPVQSVSESKAARKTIQADSTSRQYDVIIFGASGSVGKFLVEEMALVVEKYYSDHKDSSSQILSETSTASGERREPIQFAQASHRHSVRRHSIAWAVAGRSATKLSETLCQAELSTGVRGLSTRIPVVLADHNHDKSLLDMCSKARLILNCAGPYMNGAESVVKACVTMRTNYIDLSHETTFNEHIRQRYSSLARKAAIHIINGCGFQSMSAEMGLNYTKLAADGQIDEVKIILNLSDTSARIKRLGNEGCREGFKSSGIVSRGMWRSLLMEGARSSSCPGHAGGQQLSPLDKSIMSTDESQKGHGKQLQRKDTQSLVKDLMEIKNRNSFNWFRLFTGLDEYVRRYCLPTNTVTSEESQLIRGEMAHYEHRRPDVVSANGCWRPIRCTSFMTFDRLSELIVALIWLLIFNILVKISPFRSLMMAMPTITSLGHVVTSRDETNLGRDSLSHIKFCQTFLAYGTPNEDSGDPLERRGQGGERARTQLLVTRIVGPEPNHVATATYAVQAALTLLLENDQLSTGGGVLTPGSAFVETNIIHQLRRRNIKFEVVKKA